MDAGRAQRYPKLAQGRRKIVSVMPKEHGAWAMLLVPYLIGVHALGGLRAEIALGLAGILLLYLSRPALMILLKRRVIDGNFGDDAQPLLAGFSLFSSLGTAVFLWLIFGRGLTGILYLGGAGLALFLLYSWYSLTRRERSAAAEFIGVAMLTLTASLGGYLSTGALGSDVMVVWILNALYFGASVYYIKMKRRASTKRVERLSWQEKIGLAWKLLIYLTVLIVAVAALVIAGLAPLLSPVAFTPVLLYQIGSILSLSPVVNIRREGWTQTLLALAFAASMIVAYRI